MLLCMDAASQVRFSLRKRHSVSESSKDFVNHPCRLNSGQPLLQPLKLEGQPVMINAKQVHDGCIEITDMDSPTCDVAEIIRHLFDADFTPPPAIQTLKQRPW